MPRDRLDLIFSVAELASLFERSGDVAEFLHQVVATVAQHMSAPVAGVFLHDDVRGEVVLTAAEGLSPEMLTTTRFAAGHGVIGEALSTARPVSGPSPMDGCRESAANTCLAVPILRGFSKIGVLAVEHTDEAPFTSNDIKTLSAIASQLASTIENARLLMRFGAEDTGEPPPRSEIIAEALYPDFIKGTPGTTGFARGKAAVIEGAGQGFLAELAQAGMEQELSVADFEHALELSQHQIRQLEEELEETMADVSAAFIFSAHQLMLKDPEFAGRIRKLVRQGRHPAEALHQVVDDYVRLFSSNPSRVLQEKSQDVLDLGHRLMCNLTGRDVDPHDYHGRIAIATELLPSDIVKLGSQGVAGILLLRGSITAHVAIMARSLDLPLVVADDARLLTISSDTELILDGEHGNIFVNPSPEIIEQYRQMEAASRDTRQAAADVQPVTHTADGERVRLLANINLCGDLAVAQRFKAEGVGLYRSEFPFIIRKQFPSEEEQFRIYQRVTAVMRNREVAFRTLDIGGDKMLSYFPNVNEANPFMGLRAIRFSLRHREIFCAQLRAFLRCGDSARLQIMFPMVSSLDDFCEARDLVGVCRKQLADEGVAHATGRISVGAMIEVPAAVELADELAREADFLSIGSNDLVQYLLAVDRTNKHIEDFFIPHHPAVLRALKRVADAAHRAGTPLSVCGLMASDLRLLPFLIGIGIRKFSFDARKIPQVQALVRAVDTTTAAELADELLAAGRVDEVAALLDKAGAPLEYSGASRRAAAPASADAKRVSS